VDQIAVRKNALPAQIPYKDMEMKQEEIAQGEGSAITAQDCVNAFVASMARHVIMKWLCSSTSTGRR
jgi:hypothetical protein